MQEENLLAFPIKTVYQRISQELMKLLTVKTNRGTVQLL